MGRSGRERIVRHFEVGVEVLSPQGVGGGYPRALALAGSSLVVSYVVGGQSEISRKVLTNFVEQDFRTKCYGTIICCSFFWLPNLRKCFQNILLCIQ